MSKNPANWRWRCQSCGTEKVEDRLLGVVADRTEVHRLTCEGCGMVGFYDRKPGTDAPIFHRTGNFLRISESEGTT